MVFTAIVTGRDIRPRSRTPPQGYWKGNAVALIHPTDNRRISDRAGDQQPTTKPRLCLAGGFGFLILVALAVHYTFNAVV